MTNYFTVGITKQSKDQMIAFLPNDLRVVPNGQAKQSLSTRNKANTQDLNDDRLQSNKKIGFSQVSNGLQRTNGWLIPNTAFKQIEKSQFGWLEFETPKPQNLSTVELPKCEDPLPADDPFLKGINNAFSNELPGKQSGYLIKLIYRI